MLRLFSFGWARSCASAENGDRIAQFELAAPNHSRINAEIRVSEISRQERRDLQIPRARVRIDVGCRASLCAFENVEGRLSRLQTLANKVQFRPGWPARDEDVRSEAQRIDPSAKCRLKGPDAFKIDDMKAFGSDVGEAMTRARDDTWRASE